MRFRSIIRLLVPFVALGALGCRSRDVVVTLTRDEIQERVAPRFPVTKSAFFIDLVLRDPVVVLRDGTDRIGIELTADLRIPLLPALSGRIAATGIPRYEGTQKAFYLDQPVVENLRIAGLKPEYEPKARAAVEQVAREALAKHPIYEFKGRNLKEVTASFVLRGVQVRDGKLQATLALP